MPDASHAYALQARGVHKSYRQGMAEIHVLKGVDLMVKPGEFVAITGPSGSGKSTLLHVLGLMDEQDAGEILFFGQDARAMDEARRSHLRNRKLGFAFQYDCLLPDFTLLENVTMPCRISKSNGEDISSVEERARELLSRFGLAALADRFPQEVSGGERQRAAVARALINRPALLMADEPTGNLDRHNGELVFSTLKEVAVGFGVAIVLVTHNDYMSRFASRVLKLSNGLLEDGAPS